MPIPGGNNELFFATGIDNTGLNRGATQAMGIVRTMASQISKQDVFAGLAIAATVAFSKVSKELKSFSEEFEHSMKEVQTISQAVQQDFEGYSESIINLTKEVPQSANELSKAYYQIVSAGYDGAAGLNLLETSAKAAVGGVTDVQTAADGLTSVMNAWKISAEDASKVSDTFFQTVKLGKTTMGELAASISQVAPLAAAYGVSFEEVASAVATLTKQGTPTAQAMTQIRASLISVNEKLGEGWNETMTFQEALVEVAKRAKEAGKDLQTYLGGRVEGVMAVLGLTGENARIAAADLKTYAEALGVSEEALKTMIESSLNQSKLLKNNLIAALKPLGDFLAGKSTDFAKRMNEAFETGKIEAFAKMMAVGTASLVAYKIATSAAAISKIQFLRAIVRTKNAMQAFNLVAKANPVGIIVTALTAAATAFFAFRQRSVEASQTFKDFMVDVGRQKIEIEGLFGLLDKVEKGTDEYKDAIVRINEKYGDYLTNLLDEKSALEDIKKAQKEAEDAMISRLATAAKESAITEATERPLAEIAQQQKKLYKELSKVVGDEAASMALANFQPVIDKFGELQKAYKAFVNEGKKEEATAVLQEMTKIIEEYTDTYAKGGLDLFVYDVAKSIAIEEGDIDRVLSEIDAAYSGIIKKVKEKAGEVVPDAQSGGKPAFKILDPEALEDQLQTAEKAYGELDKLRAAGLEKESRELYKGLLQYGENFDQFLATMKGEYRGYAEQLKEINLYLAEVIIEDMKMAEQGRIVLAESVKDEYEKVFKDLADSIDKYSNEIEKALDVEMSTEKFEDVEKVFQFLGKIFTESELQQLESDINQFGYSLSNLGQMVARFDKEAGESIRLLGQMVNNAGAIVNFSSSEDVFALMNGIIGIADAIAGFFQMLNDKKQAAAAEELQIHARRIEESVNAINRALEEQYYILSKLEGVEWLSGAKKTIDQINKSIEDLHEVMLNDTYLTNALKAPWKGDTPENHIELRIDPDWNEEDFQKFLDEYGGRLTEESRDKMQNYLDQMRDLRREAEDLMNELRSETVGFGFDELTDSVMSMFDEWKEGAIDFGQTFEEIMYKAILNSFEQRVVAEALQPLYDELFKALDTPIVPSRIGIDKARSFGNMDEIEYARLEDLANSIFANLSTEFEGVKHFLDIVGLNMTDAGEEANSLSGAIRRGITEDTGSLVAGRMTSMMLTQREMATMINSISDTLIDIKGDTSYLHHLANIRADISEIKSQLR